MKISFIFRWQQLKRRLIFQKKHQGFSKLFEQAAKDGNKQGTPWVDGWAKEAENYTIITPSGLNSKKSKGMVVSRLQGKIDR